MPLFQLIDGATPMQLIRRVRVLTVPSSDSVFEWDSLGEKAS